MGPSGHTHPIAWSYRRCARHLALITDLVRSLVPMGDRTRRSSRSASPSHHSSVRTQAGQQRGDPRLRHGRPIEQLLKFLPNLRGYGEHPPVGEFTASGCHGAADHVFVQRHPGSLQCLAHDPVLSRCHPKRPPPGLRIHTENVRRTDGHGQGPRCESLLVPGPSRGSDSLPIMEAVTRIRIPLLIQTKPAYH